MTPEILYEDNHLLVVVKPFNMPSQEDASGDADLLRVLKTYIKDKYNKPGEVYLGLVHRLDRPTGGVMVFARTSKAAARLSEQIRKGTLHKEYLCVCEGCPEEGLYRDELIKDEEHNLVRVAKPGENGKDAQLTLKVLDTRQGHALCQITLHTGRSHQIRVQLSSRGHALLGDQKYNPAALKEQLALFSYQLSFEHPTKKEKLCFTFLPKTGAFASFDLKKLIRK